MEKYMKLSSPWVIYYKKIEALFMQDPEIRIEFDEKENTIKLYVESEEKADAIGRLLPMEKTFGNVTVKTMVIPANKVAAAKVSLFQTAFKGNPVLSFTDTVEDVFSNPLSYIVFKNEVVQYFADNMHDIHGVESTLYQDIAKDVFGEDEGICFCTDLPYKDDENKQSGLLI